VTPQLLLVMSARSTLLPSLAQQKIMTVPKLLTNPTVIFCFTKFSSKINPLYRLFLNEKYLLRFNTYEITEVA